MEKYKNLLTDREILDKIKLLKNVDEKFSFAIVEHLRRENTADLYILSDFYFFCLDLLKLKESKDYENNKRKIQYRLKKLKTKKLIDWRKSGTGFCGKTDFGMTALNQYFLTDFLKNRLCNEK